MSSRSKKKHKVLPWTPFEACATVKLSDGRTVPVEELSSLHVGLVGIWRNSRYQVVASTLQTPLGEVTHLSIKRNDRQPIHDWRDLQRIKNELVAPEREAIELYPAESRLVDTANQFHLWVMGPGVQVPLGFFDGRLVNDTESPGLAAKQRPYEEGNRPVNQKVPETLEEAQEMVEARRREAAGHENASV